MRATMGLALAIALVVTFTRPTLYGPFTGSEALNSGIVFVVADTACVGFEWRGDVGLFAGLNNDDNEPCA